MSPRRMPPWMAAPMATTSSGLISRLGLRPKIRSTAWATSGVRVWPPTSSTSSISSARRPAPESASQAGALGALHEVAHQVLELAAG